MKITICGSIAVYNQMVEIADQLIALGHQVDLPPSEVQDENGQMIPVLELYRIRKKNTDDHNWVRDRKEEAMRLHNSKIEWCDAVLVLNYDKKGVANYIGPNVFFEIGLAFYLNKQIFLLNDVPDTDLKEEILGMKPIVINQDLSKIK